MPKINIPHPDFDLGVSRGPIDYNIALPSNGCDQECGLIFYIHGYGGSYDDEYTKKLLRYLADKYNCIACCIDYFGARCFITESLRDLRPNPLFFSKLKEQYGLNVSVSPDVPMEDILSLIFNNLYAIGVRELPIDCYFLKQSDHYMSFSVLPALDHLQVMHALLQRYLVNKRRIFVIGTSYGGNIALFLNKIAPNSMRLIIDNSGFSSAEESINAVYGFMKGNIGHVGCLFRNTPHFSPEDGSDSHFTPYHAALRFLPQKDHYGKSETVIHSYHSYHDKIAHCRTKQRLIGVMRQFRSCMLHVIEKEEQLDGRAFKTLEHGMSASMRALFERSYEIYMDSSPQTPCHTDFDLETVLRLPCADRVYTVAYNRQGVQMWLE